MHKNRLRQATTACWPSYNPYQPNCIARWRKWQKSNRIATPHRRNTNPEKPCLSECFIRLGQQCVSLRWCYVTVGCSASQPFRCLAYVTLHGVTSTQLRRTLTHIDVCLSYVHPSASQLWRSSSHHQRSYCRTPTDTGPFWPNTDVTLTDMNRGCDICVRKCSKMLEEFCDSPKFTDRPWLTLTQRKWNVGIS